jgi:hypothetical protein
MPMPVSFSYSLAGDVSGGNLTQDTSSALAQSRPHHHWAVFAGLVAMKAMVAAVTMSVFFIDLGPSDPLANLHYHVLTKFRFLALSQLRLGPLL